MQKFQTLNTNWQDVLSKDYIYPHNIYEHFSDMSAFYLLETIGKTPIGMKIYFV
jgi:hypothetical protein